MGLKLTRLIRKQRELERQEALEKSQLPNVVFFDVEWSESKDVINAFKSETQLTAMPWVHLYAPDGELRHSFACGSLKVNSLLHESLAQVRCEHSLIEEEPSTQPPPPPPRRLAAI